MNRKCNHPWKTRKELTPNESRHGCAGNQGHQPRVDWNVESDEVQRSNLVRKRTNQLVDTPLVVENCIKLMRKRSTETDEEYEILHTKLVVMIQPTYYVPFCQVLSIRPI